MPSIAAESPPVGGGWRQALFSLVGVAVTIIGVGLLLTSGGLALPVVLTGVGLVSWSGQRATTPSPTALGRLALLAIASQLRRRPHG